MASSRQNVVSTIELGGGLAPKKKKSIIILLTLCIGVSSTAKPYNNIYDNSMSMQ
jgi:hypothetical protein